MNNVSTKLTVNRRPPSGYIRSIMFSATRDRVFAAIATINGLRGWWTPIISGSSKLGGQLKFEFEGLEEFIVMRVDRRSPPKSVHWMCVRHTELTEWVGTKVIFEVVELTPHSCAINFRHIGLTPKLLCYDDCLQGWTHFLASLVAYVEKGKGMPFGA